MRLLFEGIATLRRQETLKGDDDLDVYADIRLECLGELISWRGTFSLMDSTAERPEGSYLLVLSDGRSGKIHVKLDEEGQYTFYGEDYPPGFTHVGAEVKERATPPSLAQRVVHNVAAAASAGAVTASLWVDGRAIELAGTGVILMCVAIAKKPGGRHG